MRIPQEIRTQIEGANARALATYGPHGVNVVPVSVIAVTDEHIHLYDFFMGKTVDNLKDVPNVALSCWEGLTGVQVKGIATYLSEGEAYESAKQEMTKRFPERMLSGVIEITPEEVFDISAGDAAGTKLV